MSEEKIGMYSTEEIYEELATGFLHHSMVDAMYFKIKDLQQKVEQLENIRKEAIKATKDVKQFVYDELVDRNVSGATETHCKIMDLLNILNKGDNK